MVERGRYGKDYLQEIAQSPEPILSHQAYAMGWATREYHGVNIVSHNGAIDGFRCSMTLAPSAKLGIGLLTNSDDGVMKDAIETTTGARFERRAPSASVTATPAP
jgi:hypothetical protein